MADYESALRRIEIARDRPICLIIWSREDVLDQAKHRGIEITDQQADEIIEEMENWHDACMGVSWSTIDCMLDDYKEKEEKGDRSGIQAPDQDAPDRGRG